MTIGALKKLIETLPDDSVIETLVRVGGTQYVDAMLWSAAIEEERYISIPGGMQNKKLVLRAIVK